MGTRRMLTQHRYEYYLDGQKIGCVGVGENIYHRADYAPWAFYCGTRTGKRNQAGVMNLSRELYCKVYVSCPLHSIKSNIQQVNLKQRWITFSPYIIIWMINHWASIIVVFQKFWGAGHRFGGPVPPGPNVKPPLTTLHKTVVVDSRRRLRSADSELLIAPRSRLVTMGDGSLSVAGPRIWNSLPLT